MIKMAKREKQIEIKNKLIDKPVDWLIKHKFTPNKLSWLGFISSCLATLFIALETTRHKILGFLGPMFFLLSGTFDIFDGEVARRLKKSSNYGAMLDSVLDRFSDIIIIIGLVIGQLIYLEIGFIMLFLIVMISYVRSRAETLDVDMKGIGMMERAERMIYLIIALSIESGLYLFFGITFFFPVFIFIYLLLLFGTLVSRIRFAFKKLKEEYKHKRLKKNTGFVEYQPEAIIRSGDLTLD
jgi:archaetidylinositol phosphate synthase